MSPNQAESVPIEKEAPPGAPDEDELNLIGEEDEDLEPDASGEAAKEAGMSTGGVEMAPADEVTFEEDESGVAR